MTAGSSAPRISIVTPSLNQGEYLEQTMLSVLDQGYPRLEYVVMDGGSQDGSRAIIERNADRLSFWTSEKDEGHAGAVNKGFSHTSGDIMAWLNSSDLYMPWTLETVASVFTDLPSVQWIMGVPSYVSWGKGPQGLGAERRGLYDALSGNHHGIQQESVFWRRELWEAVGGAVDERFQHAFDVDLWLRFWRVAPLHHVNTVLAAFRNHPDRRGASCREVYDSEAEQAFSVFKGSFGGRDMSRARIVRVTNGRAGRLLRQAAVGAGLLSWYPPSCVTYDFEARHWTVASR
jgi:glycosyltransferase involved in cell wall biosynthesis